MTALRTLWTPATGALLVAMFCVACAGNDSMNEPWRGLESGETRPGGDTTNTLLLGNNAFISPASNLTPENKSFFFTGNSFFNQSWVIAPASTESRDGLGPLFNARSCSGCHFKDGRGRPALEPGGAHSGLLMRISLPGVGEHGGPVAEPNYGLQIQDDAIPNILPEAKVNIAYDEIAGEYGDGTPYTLLKPTYTFADLAYGPIDPNVLMSPRVAPVMIGLGLLDAIPEATLEALADPDDADDDGISGRINRVWDIAAQEKRPGRFGWKSEQPTVRQQSAGAFLGDIGITSGLLAAQNCTSTQTDCQNAVNGGEPEISEKLLNRVVLYSQTLAVPVRREWDAPEVLEGKQLFHTIGCASCHVPVHTTGSYVEVPELSNQRIWPYTDLLLHDMGEELSDNRPVYDATGSEWRTPPLWGIGLVKTVNRHERFLHDGRARGIAEAILWHGGEGEASKEAFRTLPLEEREALIRFINSL